MTIALQLNHTYRTADGKVFGPMHLWEGFKETKTGLPLYHLGDDDYSGPYWRQNGKNAEPHTDPKPELDLVEEVTAPKPLAPLFPPNGPVRQRTATVTEIVPGTHGRIVVRLPGTDPVDHLVVGLTNGHGKGTATQFLTADELDQLAQTATALAAGLRAIALEQQS